MTFGIHQVKVIEISDVKRFRNVATEDAERFQADGGWAKRPEKRTNFVALSRMKQQKGWSAMKGGGGSTGIIIIRVIITAPTKQH